MDCLELAVGVAIILMAVYLRYFAGLKTGWEIVMFWVYWIVGLFLINRARKRRKSDSN
jgi:membrane protein implicated in regulation of membrane protease activity